MRLINLALCGLCVAGPPILCTACGSPPSPAPPPATWAPVTGHIPADTPYAVVARPLALTDQELQTRLKELAESPGLHQAIRQRLIDLVGVDIFDFQSLQRTGLDIRGDFAIYGVGLRPAVLVKIADMERFSEFMEDLRRNSDAIFANRVVDGMDLYSLQLGSIQVSYTVRGDYLMAVYHHDDDPAAVVSSAMAGDGVPDLGHSDLWGRAVENVGEERHMLIGLANTTTLDRALLGLARPEKSSRYALIPPSSQSEWLQGERARLARCQARGTAVAGAVPFVVGGVGWDDHSLVQTLVVGVSPELKAALSRVLKPVSARFHALSEDAIAAFGVGLDFSALSALPVQHRDMVLCPNLAVLEGVASLLADGLGSSDAPSVFGGNIYGAIYGFDFDLWVSKRSMVLLFEALDRDAMVDGFDMYFRGIGFQEDGTEEDGALRYRAFQGLLAVHIVPLKNHVALVLGELDREVVENALTQPADPMDEVAVFELDGARLYDMLKSALESAPLGGLDTELATALVQTLGTLESSRWSLRMDSQSLYFEAIWNTVETRDDVAGSPPR